MNNRTDRDGENRGDQSGQSGSENRGYQGSQHGNERSQQGGQSDNQYGNERSYGSNMGGSQYGNDSGYQGNENRSYQGGGMGGSGTRGWEQPGDRNWGQMAGPMGMGSTGAGAQGQPKGRGPKNYKRSDTRLEEDINDRLMHQQHINAEDVEVKVANGEVTVSGSVESREHKHMIENLIDAVSGVQEIHNQLRVKRAGQSAGSSSSQSPDQSAKSNDASKAGDGDKTVDANKLGDDKTGQRAQGQNGGSESKSLGR